MSFLCLLFIHSQVILASSIKSFMTKDFFDMDNGAAVKDEIPNEAPQGISILDNRLRREANFILGIFQEALYEFTHFLTFLLFIFVKRKFFSQAFWKPKSFGYAVESRAFYYALPIFHKKQKNSP